MTRSRSYQIGFNPKPSKQYPLRSIPLALVDLIIDLFKNNFMTWNLNSTNCLIGEKTQISGVNIYNTTIVELGLEDLLKYSRKTIPFDRIPLELNRPYLPDIIKVSLVKRLELGE